MSQHDQEFMGIALAMARRALGRTWPNPAVGAVLVDPDKQEIISRGWTMPGGKPHAEVVALEKAGSRARRATLYVTLEPCAHHGRTPPCIDAIIKAGVSRVVCGIGDPDPRVAGLGFQRLMDAGIDAVTGVLAAQVDQVTCGHLMRQRAGRPVITLKMAVDSDGMIPAGNDGPVWVTGPQARACAHMLRARHDAILVGRGTVQTDDPELTCRLPGMLERSPVKVVLDSRLSISPEARIFNAMPEIPVWIFCQGEADRAARERLSARGAEIIEVEYDGSGMLDPMLIASELAGRGITRLLVEGGPAVARSFFDAGIVDEVVVFQGASKAEGERLKPFVKNGLEYLIDDGDFSEHSSRKAGPDLMSIYRKMHKNIA
jgi:diaminohydroxyphosphoribosylaminopyrimidine deaminase/5-amino-6-(5-phosphoribosylamino)uracil reductase